MGVERIVNPIVVIKTKIIYTFFITNVNLQIITLQWVWALYSIMNQLLFLVLIVVVLYLIGRLTGEDVDVDEF